MGLVMDLVFALVIWQVMGLGIGLGMGLVMGLGLVEIRYRINRVLTRLSFKAVNIVSMK